MSALTGTELVENVRGHLGDRDSGKIGSLDVDESVRRSLNKGILFLGRKFNIPDLARTIEIGVTTSTHIYTIPITQDGEDLKVKLGSISSVQAKKSGDDRFLRVIGLDWRTLRGRIGETASAIQTGRIVIYAIRGRKIYFHPFPNDSYTVNIECYIFAPTFTSSSLSNVTGLGEEWDDVIEAYATYDLWAGLQQSTDTEFWKLRYRELLIEARAANFGMLDTYFFGRHGLQGTISSDPENDPLVDSYNN